MNNKKQILEDIGTLRERIENLSYVLRTSNNWQEAYRINEGIMQIIDGIDFLIEENLDGKFACTNSAKPATAGS